MTDIERLYLFKLSQRDGFTTDWLDPNACNSDCPSCPADPACRSFWVSDDERSSANHQLWVDRFKAFTQHVDTSLTIEDIGALHPELLI